MRQRIEMKLNFVYTYYRIALHIAMHKAYAIKTKLLDC